MKVSRKKIDELGYAFSEFTCTRHELIDTVQLVGHNYHCDIKYVQTQDENEENNGIQFYLTGVEFGGPKMFFTVKTFNKLKKLNFKDGVTYLLSQFPNNAVNIINQLPLEVLEDEAFVKDMVAIVEKYREFDVKALIEKTKEIRKNELKEAEENKKREQEEIREIQRDFNI